KDSKRMEVVVHGIDESGFRFDMEFIYIEPATTIVTRRVHPIRLRSTARKAQLEWNYLPLSKLLFLSDEANGEGNVRQVLRRGFPASSFKIAFLFRLRRDPRLGPIGADNSIGGERR